MVVFLCCCFYLSSCGAVGGPSPKVYVVSRCLYAGCLFPISSIISPSVMLTVMTAVLSVYVNGLKM